MQFSSSPLDIFLQQDTSSSTEKIYSSSSETILPPGRKRRKLEDDGKGSDEEIAANSSQEDDDAVDNFNQQQNARRRQDFRTLMNAPDDIETNPKKYPKALVAIYNACKAHWEIVKDIKQIDGQYMYWNFPCLDWSLPANVGRILAGCLHYDTIENAGSLKGSLHCATAMHSDG